MKNYILPSIALLLATSCLDESSDQISDIPGEDDDSQLDGKSDSPTVSIASAIRGQRFTIQKNGLNGSNQRPPSNGSYISVDLPATTFSELKTAVQTTSNVRLKARGEAHITVITPPEFSKVGRFVPISELEALAKSSNLQKSSITAKCIGIGQVGREQTVYVVVESPELLAFRNAVKAKIIARGGAADVFKPSSYFPHITVGSTKRDLHESDGVIKSVASCPSSDNLEVR